MPLTGRTPGRMMEACFSRRTPFLVEEEAMTQRLLVASAAVLAVCLSVATDARADDKWVKGKVTALSGETLTVTVQGKAMTFTVTKDTDVVARGAGTRTEAARKEGRAGVALDQLIKVGDGVEVHYTESGTTLHATEIRGGVSVGSGSMSGSSARGTVTAVTASSLSVRSGDRDVTYSIDKDTRVIGEGVGTITEQRKKAGQTTAFTDLVSVGDSVSVNYHDMGASRHASEVRIRQKASKTM
jgi:hypothetical protein